MYKPVVFSNCNATGLQKDLDAFLKTCGRDIEIVKVVQSECYINVSDYGQSGVNITTTIIYKEKLPCTK